MKLFRQNGSQRSRDSQNGTLGDPRFASLASDNAWSADRKGAEADLLNVSLHFSFGPGIEEHRVGRGSDGGHECECFYTGTAGRLREDKRECIVDITEGLLRTCLRLRRSQGTNDGIHVPGLHSWSELIETQVERINQFVLRHQRSSGGRNDFGNSFFGKSLVQGRPAHQTCCSQQ